MHSWFLPFKYIFSTPKAYLGRLGKPRQLHGWWATSICIPRTSREKPSSFMDGGLQVYAYLGRLGRRQAALWMVGYIGILVQNLHMYLNTANLKQQNIPWIIAQPIQICFKKLNIPITLVNYISHLKSRQRPSPTCKSKGNRTNLLIYFSE